MNADQTTQNHPRIFGAIVTNAAFVLTLLLNAILGGAAFDYGIALVAYVVAAAFSVFQCGFIVLAVSSLYGIDPRSRSMLPLGWTALVVCLVFNLFNAYALSQGVDLRLVAAEAVLFVIVQIFVTLHAYVQYFARSANNVQQRLDREEEIRMKQSDHTRRENARISCEVLYTLHASEIGEQFSKQQFDEFIQKYMGDNQPADVVEQRSEQLQQVIRQHYEKSHPEEQVSDLETLVSWYVEQKSRIESMPVADGFKKVYLTQLNVRYTELTEMIMEQLKP